MSVSSRTVLRPGDLEKIAEAQRQAAEQPTYKLWVKWMKEHYNYSFAVRAALHLGFKKPGHEFYRVMKEEGHRLLQGPNAPKSLFVPDAVNL